MTIVASLPTSRVPDPGEAPPLRWGIIGTGGIARNFADALRKHTRQVVYAVGSRAQATADAFAADLGAERAYGSSEALVADANVQAVYVASPHPFHLEHALLAIGAGKPVLVEKPFTMTAAEARVLVSAAREAGVPALEAMWTRFLPHIDVVRQLLADQALGELESVAADHGQYFAVDPTHRLYAPELGGGAVLDLGIYPVSFAHFVLGGPGRIVGSGTRAVTGVDRQVSAVLDGHAAHPHAHALVSTTLAARTPTTASVSGSLARLELPGPFYIPQPIRLIDRTGGVLASPQPTITAHEGLCFEAAHFATMVAAGQTESPLLGLDESVDIMATLDALRALVD